MNTKANAFWQDFKDHFLKKNKSNPVYRYWLDPIISSKIEKEETGFCLTLQTPSDLHKKWLQENILKAFYHHIQQFYKGSCKVQLEVETPKLPSQTNPYIPKDVFAKKQKMFFNPDYTFENFVVGKNNELAYEASLAITKNRKIEKNFNPLFIYSPSGLGKTHLLNAIGQCILKLNPQSRIIYLSAERFLNEYITALQYKKMGPFRKKFRKNCDLLLMDDIQIVAKGREIQEEFFHTFNELYNKKTQVVVCCDQPPSCVPRLEERIRTRLEGGLMVDISYPDKETRRAILKDKIEKRGLFLSSQGLEQIAASCKRSIREMEGVINKIKIMTELHEGSLSLKEVEKILKNLQKELTVDEIQQKVAKTFSLSMEDIKSTSRKKPIVTARQTAMYLIRLYLKKSLNDISIAFGKKDHTTVLNSIKKVEKLKSENVEFKRVLEFLQREIHNDYSTK